MASMETPALNCALGVQGSILMVFPTDTGHDLLHLLHTETVLVGIGEGNDCEPCRGGQVGQGAVGILGRNLQTTVTAVLQLLGSDRHDHVICHGYHRVAGVAKRIQPGTTHVGENGDVGVILVHSRAAEDKFVAGGFGVNRKDVMYNALSALVIAGLLGVPLGSSFRSQSFSRQKNIT